MSRPSAPRVVGLRPQLRAGVRIDQMRRDAHARRRLPDAAADDVARAQRSAICRTSSVESLKLRADCGATTERLGKRARPAVMSSVSPAASVDGIRIGAARGERQHRDPERSRRRSGCRAAVRTPAAVPTRAASARAAARCRRRAPSGRDPPAASRGSGGPAGQRFGHVRCAVAGARRRVAQDRRHQLRRRLAAERPRARPASRGTSRRARTGRSDDRARLPSICSGDMYGIVPTMVPSLVSTGRVASIGLMRRHRGRRRRAPGRSRAP